jgi:hypothetical protein
MTTSAPVVPVGSAFHGVDFEVPWCNRHGDVCCGHAEDCCGDRTVIRAVSAEYAVDIELDLIAASE